MPIPNSGTISGHLASPSGIPGVLRDIVPVFLRHYPDWVAIETVRDDINSLLKLHPEDFERDM